MYIMLEVIKILFKSLEQIQHFGYYQFKQKLQIGQMVQYGLKINDIKRYDILFYIIFKILKILRLNNLLSQI